MCVYVCACIRIYNLGDILINTLNCHAIKFISTVDNFLLNEIEERQQENVLYLHNKT